MDEQKLKEKLTPEQYRVMRQKGTETPFVGKYWDHDERGLYSCAVCDRVLFSSLQKFDAQTGWPSFHKPIRQKHIELVSDEQGAEIRCAGCQSHLGYLIEGDKKHYRINSVCLNFLALGDIELPENEEGDQENNDQKASKSKSLAKNISFAMGGIAIGVAVGVGAAPSVPQATCTLSPIVTTAMPKSTPRSTLIPTSTSTPDAGSSAPGTAGIR